MKKTNVLKMVKVSLVAGFVGSLVAQSALGQPVFSFPFDEGGTNVSFVDSAQSLTGYFGSTIINPEVDTAALTNDSPSGLPGDGSFFNSGKGFLVADDSADKVLNITNGPITTESWIKINGSVSPGSVEGIISYGGSYKMGLKNGVLVFTLLGKVDITNSYAGALPIDTWIHVAAAWQPGSGVNFYVKTPSLTTNKFVANTNTTARVLQHNYLSLGNEGFSNPLVASFDRARIHNAVLTEIELDNEAATPKTNYPSTIVSYDFNEADLPANNSLTPALPAVSGAPLIPIVLGPVWTNGVSGTNGDYALYFDGTKRAIVPDTNLLVTLGPDVTGTNGDYTLQAWVKLPLGFEPTARMVMFQYQYNPAFSFSINIGRTLHTTTLGKNDVPSGAVIPNDNQWHHVAAVHQNETEVRFYVDGVFLSRMPYIRGPGAQTALSQVTIGGAATANSFTGTLDRISLTKGALTPEQFDIPNYVPPTPLPAGDTTTGLLLRLKLDETNGLTAVDSSGGNRNGTLINFTNDNSQWVIGRLGGALRFQTNAGTAVTNSTRVQIPDPTNLFNFSTNGTARTTSTFSVAAWIYAGAPQIVGAGIIARGFGPEQFALDVQSGGNVRFIVRNPTGTPLDVISIGSNNNLRTTSNRWVHVVGTIDGSQTNGGLKIYLDGVLANANTAPSSVFNVVHDVTVGAREFNSTSGYSQAFQGLIDDVRVYDRTLSPADVATIYQEAEIPRLSILPTGVLSWTITSTNFIPQFATSLSLSNTVWTDLPGTATTNGYEKTWPISLTSSNEFYRLRSVP